MVLEFTSIPMKTGVTVLTFGLHFSWTCHWKYTMTSGRQCHESLCHLVSADLVVSGWLGLSLSTWVEVREPFQVTISFDYSVLFLGPFLKW